MVSILENNQKEKIVFHILYQGKQENKIKITNMVEKYQQKVIFYENFEKHQDFLKELQYLYEKKGRGNWSFGTFFRLLIPLVIPSKVEKALYLDGDVIVNNSLKSLFEIKVEKALLVNYSIVKNSFSPLFAKKKLKYFFNAGVVLFNLKKIKKNYSEEIIKLYKENLDVISYADQDLLTLYFQKDLQFIEEKFNYCIHLIQQIKKNLINKEVVIYHFMRKFFQCNPDFSHPCYREFYFHYLDLTPWKNWRPKRDIIRGFIVTTYWGYFLDSFLYKIKIREYLKNGLDFIRKEK